MSPSELKHRFTYHPPKAGQPEKYEKLRAGALIYATLINELAPETLEKQTAIERIEESVMWANAAIARFG